MKFSMYFDVISCISNRKSTARKAAMRKHAAALEALEQKSNPREGRYFTKPESPVDDIPDESEIDEEPSENLQTDAEEKPIGNEIPEPIISDSEESVEEEPIQTETPDEDDEELYSTESVTNTDVDEIETEKQMIDDILSSFSMEEIMDESSEEPAEESVGRETPLLPTVLRKIEAEDSETPIPVNVSVEVNKETANTKIDTSTYVDKKEEKNKKYVMTQIRGFVDVPLSKKKKYANNLYTFIIDNNVDIDLSKYRMIWKLVDKPFIASKE